MAIFMDIELVSIEEAEPPDAFTVTFDVIYPGETWCRSVVFVDSVLAARLQREEQAVIRTARDGLLELLLFEPAPVSFHLRLGSKGCAVLARASPTG